MSIECKQEFERLLEEVTNQVTQVPRRGIDDDITLQIRSLFEGHCRTDVDLQMAYAQATAGALQQFNSSEVLKDLSDSITLFLLSAFLIGMGDGYFPEPSGVRSRKDQFLDMIKEHQRKKDFQSPASDMLGDPLSIWKEIIQTIASN